MTRWNPCCCDQVVILPQDMVLVRAGWYHFMVMTKDGRINVFGDAGIRSDGNTLSGGPNYFWINGQRTRNSVGPEGADLSSGVTSCWSLTDYSIRKLKKDEDLDPYGWLLTHNGINSVNPHPYTPGDRLGQTYFGMVTLYPEACDGFSSFPCQNGNPNTNKPGDFCGQGDLGACCGSDKTCKQTYINTCNGYFQGPGTVCTDPTTGEEICNVPGACCITSRSNQFIQTIKTAFECAGHTLGSAVDGVVAKSTKFFGNETDWTMGFSCSSQTQASTVDLCPYYEIEGLVGGVGVLEGAERLWPHGHFDFYGEGSSISRPPKTIRHEELTKVRGLSGQTDQSTLVEKYQPMAEPVAGFHPLAIPEDLQQKITSKETRVIDIECGAYHNIVRLDDNSIVCWGLNSMGQCNVPEELKPDWSRKTDTAIHPKKSKICSIHAGFNTTAVVFNDGTALCWGDPDVANAVNQWDNIRISPIKRKPAVLEGEVKSCNGIASEGFPDPQKPQFPANKYNNGTFNANTDWFQLWRSGTPVYPHFDLGVETKYVNPVNAVNIGPDNSIPGNWCDDCNNRKEVKKDFAVGMLRSGQIVTTRKTNAPTEGKNRLLSRDCNIDEKYTFNAGFVNPGDATINFVDTVFTVDGPQGPETIACADVIASTYGPYEKCTPSPCSAYDNLSYTLQTGETRIKPEGIGCYSSLKEAGEGVLYDPNWAKGSIYNPGQQIRPQGFTGGRWPSWNFGDFSYGWETKASATSRIRGSSIQTPGLDPVCRANGILGGRCSFNLGQATPCNQFCPSNSNFRWRNGSILIDYFTQGNEGVPGHFRYPVHIATTLTCIAGTNTVNWVHSARLLGKSSQLSKPASDPIEAETSLWTDGCEKHHKNYTDCGECDYVGGNSTVPDDEIGDTRTSCIYSSYDDLDGMKNPLAEPDPSGTPQQFPTTWMLPTRPWGSWQLKLLTGTATPPKLDMDICSWNVLRRYGCSYITIQKFGDAPTLIDPYISGRDFIPIWFVENCQSELNYTTPIPAFGEKKKWDGTLTRAIRRGTGFWPTSNAWARKRDDFSALDCSNLPECDPKSPFFVPYSGGRCGVAPFTSARISGDTDVLLNCKASKIPCNGDMPPNLFHYCYGVEDDASERGDRQVFPPAAAAPTCRGNKGTYEFCGITGCEMGIEDECNKWCFDNPTLSYATGRSFGIFLRRSPWKRGPDGEFIWEKHCSKTNADYSFRSFDEQGYGRDFDGTQGTKLWLTGTLYDPCPPWPRRCGSGGECEAAGLTGLTCGTYPTWVPVPDQNTSNTQKTRKRYACKGYWEQDTEQYINTKKYSNNWIFQEEECEKSFNMSVFLDPDIKDTFKIDGENLIDIFIRYIGYEP